MDLANVLFGTTLDILLRLVLILLWAWGGLYSLAKSAKYHSMLLGALACGMMGMITCCDLLMNMPASLLIVLPYQIELNFAILFLQDIWAELNQHYQPQLVMALLNVCLVAGLIGRYKLEDIVPEQAIPIPVAKSPQPYVADVKKTSSVIPTLTPQELLHLQQTLPRPITTRQSIPKLKQAEPAKPQPELVDDTVTLKELQEDTVYSPMGDNIHVPPASPETDLIAPACQTKTYQIVRDFGITRKGQPVEEPEPVEGKPYEVLQEFGDLESKFVSPLDESTAHPHPLEQDSFFTKPKPLHEETAKGLYSPGAGEEEEDIFAVGKNFGKDFGPIPSAAGSPLQGTTVNPSLFVENSIAPMPGVSAPPKDIRLDSKIQEEAPPTRRLGPEELREIAEREQKLHGSLRKQKLAKATKVVAEPIAVEPAVAKPVEPVVAKPVEPVVAKPVISEPVEPVVAEPVVAEPVEPVVAEPVELVVAKPVESIVAKPVEPIPAEPLEPIVAEPVEPVSAPIEPVPAEPVVQVSAARIESVVAKPVPAEPVVQVVAKPIVAAPAEPVVQVPAARIEPAVAKSVESVAPAATESIATVPIEPIAAKPVEPIATGTKKTMAAKPVEPKEAIDAEPTAIIRAKPAKTVAPKPAGPSPSKPKVVEPAPEKAWEGQDVEEKEEPVASSKKRPGTKIGLPAKTAKAPKSDPETSTSEKPEPETVLPFVPSSLRGSTTKKDAGLKFSKPQGTAESKTVKAAFPTLQKKPLNPNFIVPKPSAPKTNEDEHENA